MIQALFFKPSYERLKDRIDAIAPDLDVCLYDEQGQVTHQGREIDIGSISPAWYWIHTELYFSPRLHDYFQLMLQSPSISWLHTINTGLDKLPYLELVDKGVTVTNNHAQAIAIAEYVLGQVLAHYQDVADFRVKQQGRIWRHRGFRELCDSHWLIVGFGHIGREIARRARAFGVRITVVRRGSSDEGLADAVVPLDQVYEALPSADVVVLACASNDQTRNLVDERFLGAMKERSVLVNIARGDLVVEQALRAALDAGKPEYAILDVFNTEPPPPDAWVWEHPRVALTPHTSNAGSGMRRRSEEIFVANLERMINGQPVQNQVSRRDIV